MLGRTAATADAFSAPTRPERHLSPELHALMKDFQCTKWFVNRKAIEIVDRALTASGGAGLSGGKPFVEALQRRAGRSVHAVVLAERGLRVYRSGHARARSTHRRLKRPAEVQN